MKSRQVDGHQFARCSVNAWFHNLNLEIIFAFDLFFFDQKEG